MSTTVVATVEVYRAGVHVATYADVPLEEPTRRVRPEGAELYARLPREADVRAGDELRLGGPVPWRVLGGRITRGAHTRVPLATAAAS